MNINIVNETGKLSVVVIGIADDFGGIPRIEQCYDPKSKAHVIAGTYPVEQDCVNEIDALVIVLEKYDVEVLRPKNINGLNQIFSRDIAFVIADKLILPNIIENRQEEVSAISDIVNQILPESILRMPVEAKAEGGDVMLWN